jgi:hypothetical protein
MDQKLIVVIKLIGIFLYMLSLAALAELSSSYRDYMFYKSEIFTIWLFANSVASGLD